jgi:peptidoglycan DL-endopeptidase CwlO
MLVIIKNFMEDFFILMKKKLLRSMMLSTVALTVVAPLSTVDADFTDSKIATQDAKIASIKDEAVKAHAQVAAVETQVALLKEKQVSMKADIGKLLRQQKVQSGQVQELTRHIQERTHALEAQARSAQTDGSATNILSAILDSKSLTDAIQKITAMTTVAGANKAMIEQQEKDQKELRNKLKDNQEKYAKVTRLEQELSNQADELATQEAQLKVAQLGYQATISTEQGKKAELLNQKAEAEQVAKVAKKAQQLAAGRSLVAQQEKAKVSQEKSTVTRVETQPTPEAPPVIEDGGNGGGNIDKPQPPIPTLPPTNTTNPYPAGQCTAYVWEYFGGKIPTYEGNAGDWEIYSNSGPAVGTIAVFPPCNQGAGGVGHVAVVISVSGSTMRVKEGNFNGGWGTERECSTEGVSFIRP